MKKHILPLFILHCSLFIVLSLSSCASGQGKIKFPYASRYLEKGDYSGAREDLQRQRANPYSEYNLLNEISYLQDRGYLAHYAGDYRTSNDDLLEAERAMEEAYTKSVTERAKRVVKNDPYKIEYIGEDYEDFYLNIFTALNFYNAGNFESAMVEIRKVNNKMKFIADKYESRMVEIGSSNWRDQVSGTPTYYYKSALAGYLGMLFWRAYGNSDSARIDAQSITDAYAQMPEVYSTPLPKELVMRGDVNDELAIPAGMARLNVLSFTGLSPLKSGSEGIADLTIRRSAADRIEIVFDDGKKTELSLLEPISNVVYQIARTRIFYKTAEENFLMKAGQFKQDTEFWGNIMVDASLMLFMPALIGKYTIKALVDYSTSGGNYDTEDRSVDRRMARFIPGKAWVGGINLRPGDYSFTINYYKGTNVIDSRKIQNYKVEARKLNLIEDFCLNFDFVRQPPVHDFTMNNRTLPDYPGRLSAPTNFTWGEESIAEANLSKGDWGGYSIAELAWDPVPGTITYWVYYTHGDGTKYNLYTKTIEPKIVCYPSSSYRVIAFGNEGYGEPSKIITPRKE
jgi:hypothetical protein